MSSEPKYRSIGADEAIRRFDAGWWKNKSPHEIVMDQFFTDELMMPWAAFHEAVEAVIGRPVFTHEFGLDRDGLAAEIRAADQKARGE